MSGLSAAESLGHGWKQALHPDDREKVFEEWKTNALQGASWEYRLLTPEGEIRWIRALGGPIYSDRGEVTGYVGTVEDITERKHAHRALEEREALNRAVLNSVPANIAVLKGDGTIQTINEEWQRFTEANGDPPACFLNRGANYLEACKQASDGGSSDAGKALSGIQNVLSGRLQSFRMQYPCHSDTEKRWFRMTVTPLAGVTTSGVVITHADITEPKRAELALQESRQELRALAGRLINAEEQERRRISRELHDGLNQKLACLAFDADGLRMVPFSSEDKIREQLFSLRTRIVELSKDVREISHKLHPSILEDLGLTAALHELCEEYSARDGIKVLFTAEAVPPAIPDEVAACLYRVAQEALHNVLKHAEAGSVQMNVTGDSGGIYLSIKDTGVGFDSEAGLRQPGLGIVSMKERVRLVQGEFSIHSQSGQGTEVRVFVPLPKEASRRHSPESIA
jgi:signal transduction histidine kinase